MKHNLSTLFLIFAILILLCGCVQRQTEYVCSDGTVVSNSSLCPKPTSTPIPVPTPTPTVTPTPIPTATPTPEPTPTPTPDCHILPGQKRINEAFSIKFLEYVVVDAKEKSWGDPGIEFSMSITNYDDARGYAYCSGTKIVDSLGREYDVEGDEGVGIPPGSTRLYRCVSEIPSDAKNLAVEFREYWTDNQLANVNLCLRVD